MLWMSLMAGLSSYGQSFEKVLLNIEDTARLYVNDGQSNELHYLKRVPAERVNALIVLLPSAGETTDAVAMQLQLPETAMKNGIMTIIPSLNFGTDNRVLEIKVINEILREVEFDHHVPMDKVFMGGLSNGGVIALSYAEMCVKDSNLTYVIPCGVFGLDVPLDKAHLYEYCVREVERNHSEVGVAEAKWLMSYFEDEYGGSPNEMPMKYAQGSVFSYGHPSGGNALYLKDMPIRMYTDLDVDWLLNERHRDLYDWNGTDIVAMINVLKMMGNKDANVVISMGKGVRLNGIRHPHSWSIMDSEDCLNWMLGVLSGQSSQGRNDSYNPSTDSMNH